MIEQLKEYPDDTVIFLYQGMHEYYVSEVERYYSEDLEELHLTFLECENEDDDEEDEPEEKGLELTEEGLHQLLEALEMEKNLGRPLTEEEKKKFLDKLS